MSKLVTLPMYCVHCGGPVSLIYEPGTYPVTGSWSCPYTICQKPQIATLNGSIRQVSGRSDSPTR